MYCVTEEQVAYILNDIRRNGVEMEDLQLNLLDHICCIIEQEFKEGERFEDLYLKTVRKFYNHELREIEEETRLLLTFKYYYAMRNLMIVCGAISVLAFIAGSFFKVMHWPGANIMLFSGCAVFSLVFLPLMMLLKTKEMIGWAGRLEIITRFVTGILLSLATLFTVMHWPGATMLWFSGLFTSAFLFIPAYFYSGINRPGAKLNTIFTSIVLIAATALLFMMVRLRPTGSQALVKTFTYAQNERLLRNMQHSSLKMQSTAAADPLTREINNTCEQIKGLILTREIGQTSVPEDFEQRGLFFDEKNLGKEFMNNGTGVQLIIRLKGAVDKYNARREPGSRIPVGHSIVTVAPDKIRDYTNLSVLNSVTQIQMFLASEVKETGVALND